MDDSKLSIRTATIYDFDRIIELYKQLYTKEYLIESKVSTNIREPEEYFLSRSFKKEVNSRRKKIEDKKTTFVVAVYDEKIIGYTNGSVKYNQREKTYILFDDEVIVDEAYSNKRVGDLLIREIVSWGKKRGAKKMMVFIFKDNKPSRNKYSRLGLRERHTCLYKEI